MSWFPSKPVLSAREPSQDQPLLPSSTTGSSSSSTKKIAFPSSKVSCFVFLLSASAFVFLTIFVLSQNEHSRVIHISGSIGGGVTTKFGDDSDISSPTASNATSVVVTNLDELYPPLSDGFSSRLNPAAHSTRPSVSHVLTWIVRYQSQWAADGVTKGVYTVNGQFPGPTIEARSGDRIILTVRNELPGDETTAIHFHGIRHLGSNAMDGAIGVTQCPIPTNSSFTYDFTLDEEQSGSFWWHSHSGHQRADGLYGGFIIHKPTYFSNNPLYSDKDSHSLESQNSDEEHLIMIGDWYHRTAHEMVDWYRSKKSVGWEPTPDNVLFNGVNTFDCGRLIRWYECSPEKGKKPLIVMGSDPSRRKKIRVVNSGNLADIEVSLGSHTLIIIEADGSPVKPYTVSSVLIAPGQRYAFYIEYNESTPIKTGESFWMRMRLNPKDFNMPNPILDVVQFVPIFYNDPRYIPLFAVSPTRDFSIRSDTAQPSFDPFQLEASEQNPLPAADIQIMMYVNTMKLDRLGGIPYGYINQSSWEPDLNSPMILRDTAEMGPGSWATEHELVYVTDRRKAKVLEVIINNLDDGPHSFHLHGHHFYPLTTFKSRVGWGSYDYKVGHTAPQFSPVLRDTMTIPRRGYAVIRFTADAPGLWLFHCHMLVHLSSGMAMLFSVRPDSIPYYERLSAMDSCVHN